MGRSSVWFRRGIAALVTLALQLPPGAVLPFAHAEDVSGEERLRKAREAYVNVKFDDAIAILREILEKELLPDDGLQSARELLARTYVKRGVPLLARQTFVEILRIDPHYRPDPQNVPPDEYRVFEQAHAEFRRTTKKPRWWLWAGGAAGAGVIALALSGKKDSQTRDPSPLAFPGPPAFP